MCCVIQLLLLFFKIVICRNVLKTLSPEETRMQQNPVFSRKPNYLIPKVTHMQQNLVISGLGPFISHVFDFVKFIISGFFFITNNFFVTIPAV